MKRLAVVIPTRKRIAKLIKSLESIPNKEFISIEVICDGDEETYNEIVGFNKPYLNVQLVPQHSGSAACRNLVIRQATDGVLYSTDDVTFKKGAIEHAFELFNKMFPDDDGVVGFHQEGQNRYHPTGVALVGNKFLERYPGRQLFYPGYYHFCCQEVYCLAEELGKFILDRGAVLYHFHPGTHNSQMDTTHIDARRYKKRDFDIRRRRSAEGLVWGKNG